MAKVKAFVATEEEARLLKWLLHKVKTQRERITLGNQLDTLPGPPTKCYIAKLPEDGIPPLEILDPEVETDDEPGNVGNCIVASIYEEDDGRYTLHPMDLELQVFNLSLTRANGPYQLVVQESSGRWILAGGGSNSSGILFTLRESLASGSAEATVDLSWGRTPTDINDVAVGIQVDVYDDQFLFNSAFTGANGIAVYDPDNEKYRVVECESKAGYIIIKIFNNSLSGLIVNDWSGGQQDIQNPSSLGTPTVVDSLALLTNLPPPLGAESIFRWGFCVYDALTDAYALVSIGWCNLDRFSVGFTLTGDMYGGSGAAVVTGTALALTVYDSTELFPLALTGAQGIAVWSRPANKWVVANCNQKATKIRAVLGADLTSSSGIVGSVTVMSPPPHSQEPTVTTMSNELNLGGRSGDIVIGDWDHSAGAYVITQVQHRDKAEVTDVRVNGLTLQKRQQVFKTLSSEDEGDFTTFHTGTQCPPP